MLQTLSADRPELSLGVGGDRRSFSIKQANLSELQPEYDAGNLSAPCGDKVGVKLPSHARRRTLKRDKVHDLKAVQVGLPCFTFQVANVL